MADKFNVVAKSFSVAICHFRHKRFQSSMRTIHPLSMDPRGASTLRQATPVRAFHLSPIRALGRPGDVTGKLVPPIPASAFAFFVKIAMLDGSCRRFVFSWWRAYRVVLTPLKVDARPARLLPLRAKLLALYGGGHLHPPASVAASASARRASCRCHPWGGQGIRSRCPRAAPAGPSRRIFMDRTGIIAIVICVLGYLVVSAEINRLYPPVASASHRRPFPPPQPP